MSLTPTQASHPTTLTDRTSVQTACLSYIRPLLPFLSPLSSRIRLGATATHYDDVAASLEGFARPLWGLAALLYGSGRGCGDDDDEEFPESQRWVDGLVAGTDPESGEYWGEVRDKDQRMVEMCPLGWFLCLCGPGEKGFWNKLTEVQKGNVVKWLGSVNHKEMPDTNWLWFRVFANLGLRAVGAPHSVEKLQADTDHLDTFYVGDGWSCDGPDGAQMDYYSGPFAIHTSQLIYSKLCASSDPVRAEEYRNRARQYALDLVHYFDPEGRAIPFGRSTTYRFAMAAFWSTLAYADVEQLPAPLSWGVVKGLLLRNLRWWSTQPILSSPAATLTIGYAYPNMFFTENYNSPGSPYWGMKAFIALAASEAHPFWAEPEEEYPLTKLPAVVALKRPGHIVSHRGGHTFLLSSGQACSYPLRATQAKYGKFAYSSAFGFSVPTGSYMLNEHAIDSMLGLSLPEDGGETWKTRRLAPEARIEEIDGGPVLVSKWHPWHDVEVETWLVPPTEARPNWYLRVHRIKTGRALCTAEGGWAIYGQEEGGRHLPEWKKKKKSGDGHEGNDGYREQDGEAYAVSRAGAVGIVELVEKKKETQKSELRRGGVLRLDANANLMEGRTVLPTLYGDLEKGEYWFVTAVFGVPADAGAEWRGRWWEEWNAKPQLPEWVKDRLS